MKLSGSLSDLQRQGAANYTVDFGYYLQAFVEGSYYDNRQAGIEPERKLMAGFTITLDAGGKKSKLAPLYADLKDRDDLKLPDLVPTSRIITSQIEVMERVSYNQHEIRIDKTMLPGSSYLEKNADGSLRALNLDTGATNLVSVSSINYSQHAPFFSVTG